MDPLARDLLERIALVIALTDPADPDSIGALVELLGELDPAMPGATECLDLKTRLVSAPGDDTLDALAAHVDAMVDGPERNVAHPPEALAQRDVVEEALEGVTELDPDDLELVAEFVDEAADGLAEADSVLLEIERREAVRDDIDRLFRVFHTLKGVSGFLGLTPIASLAHRTEELLDRVREGRATLQGKGLDLVFDATELMRSCLAATAAALTNGGRLLPVPGVTSLVRRLEAHCSGVEAPLPSTEVEEREAPSVTPPAAQVALVPGEGRMVRPRATVRVALERVDSLVEQIGELAIIEAMIANAPEISALESPRVGNLMSQLTKISRDLQGLGMRMRMVPLEGAFQKIARMGRELSRKSHKDLRVVFEGGATEMDRRMVEQIGDPLVHIVRNSVDHGIERPAERAETDKDPVAEIRLSAYHHGGNIVIEVADDGRGLSRERILARARERGLVGPDDVLSDNEVWELVFAAGFSTAAEVTTISGRGVGMDVVRRKVGGMRGRVALLSEAGRGTTVRMILPLTTAIIDGMLVRCGEERFIVPTLAILESVQPRAEMLGSAPGGVEFLNLRDEIIPLLRLDRLLEVPGAISDPLDALVLVVEAPGQKVGVLIDDVLAQQQVVIKSLGDGLGPRELISGGAILADGRVGLILSIEGLTALVDRRALRQATSDAA